MKTRSKNGPGRGVWYALAALWCLLLAVISAGDLFAGGALAEDRALGELRGELETRFPSYYPELVNSAAPAEVAVADVSDALNFRFFSGTVTKEGKSARFLAAYRRNIVSGRLARANVLCGAGDNAFVVTGRTAFFNVDGALTSGQTRIFTDLRVNTLIFAYAGAPALAALFAVQGRRTARRQAERLRRARGLERIRAREAGSAAPAGEAANWRA